MQLVPARLLRPSSIRAFVLGVSLLLASGLARTASAQTGVGGASGAAALAAADLLIVVQSMPGVAIPDFDLQRFFNINNCQCNTPVYVFFTFTQSGFAKKRSLGAGTIEFFAGLNCNNITVRNCTKLGDTIMLATFGAQGGVVVPTTTQTLSQNFGQPAITSTAIDGGVLISDAGTTGTGTGVCSAGTAFSQTIWALVTFSGDAPYDVSATISVPIDTAPPPQPANFKLSSGNEAVIANWDILDTSVNVDMLGYQLLCDRGGTLQVFPNGSFGAGFQTCAATPLPGGLHSNLLGLDPNYVCSPLLTNTASSFRIKILQNDITYGVGLVAIDTHYNASAPLLHFQAPQKTLSFYDVYRNGDEANNMPNSAGPDPGKATGGFCAVAGDTGRAAGGGGLAVVALAFGLGFAARRRRSPRR